MNSYAKILAFVPVLLIGIVLQFFLVKVDSIDTPEKAALNFISLYYKVDPGMEDRLCRADVIDGEYNKVEKYIAAVEAEAIIRGYLPKYMRFALFNVEKYRMNEDESHVKVKLEASKRRAIRDAYPFITGLFGLGKVEEIEHELTMVKEDGIWKVCDFTLL